MDAARRVWDVLEPIAANVYFSPEVHGALEKLGFGGGTPGPNGIHYPDGPAYFISRGAPLGDQVSGDLIAAAFGVFKREMVRGVVQVGWSIAPSREAVLDARQEGAVTSLRRMLGMPEELGWVTDVLRRMIDAGPFEGRHLSSGLLDLGIPDNDPMAAFWRAADIVREHRGDSHIAAWITADLDACEIGLLTDPWRGQPLKSWVRSRAWSEEELEAGCERLRSRSLLAGDQLTDTGMQLREDIETATDQQERRMVEAIGDDADRFFTILDGWAQQVVDQGGYPGRVQWSASTNLG
jgi:hypothetical protein